MKKNIKQSKDTIQNNNKQKPINDTTQSPLTKRTRLLMIAVVGLLLVFGLIATLHRPKTLGQLLPWVASDVQATFSNQNTQINQWQAEASVIMPWDVPGYDFTVAPTNAPTLTVSSSEKTAPKTIKRFGLFKKTVQPAAKPEQVTARIGLDLTRSGFTFERAEINQYKYTYNFQQTNGIVGGEIYSRGDETCVLPRTPDGLIQLSCFSKASLQAMAASAKPFVDAYVAGNSGVKPSDITIGPIDIKSRSRSGVIGASETPHYDIAEALLIANKYKQLVLFYETSGTWHYVTSASDEYGFSCADMRKNPNARKAFLGQVCYEQGKGRIRLDSNRSALQ